MRFRGTCYRAHDPQWAFTPTSGAGAAIHGGRFNPKGVEALYLALSLEGAIHELQQGFAMKLKPCTICSYDVDCDDVADLSTADGRTRHGIALADLSGAWKDPDRPSWEPPSWKVAAQLAGSFVGIVVPSFVVGAKPEWLNLVLWTWSDTAPHRVVVHDPDGRLPKDRSSWTSR